MALRLEDTLDAAEHAPAKLLEFEPAVVEDLARHGRQDALRHGVGPGTRKNCRPGRRGSFVIISSRVFFVWSRRVS